MLSRPHCSFWRGVGWGLRRLKIGTKSCLGICLPHLHTTFQYHTEVKKRYVSVEAVHHTYHIIVLFLIISSPPPDILNNIKSELLLRSVGVEIEHVSNGAVCESRAVYWDVVLRESEWRTYSMRVSNSSLVENYLIKKKDTYPIFVYPPCSTSSKLSLHCRFLCRDGESFSRASSWLPKNQ